MPQNTNPDDLTLDMPVSHSDSSYRERLKHWAVMRLLPNMKNVVVARFRSRSDADGHLRFLRRNVPEGEFIVVFDSH